nr:RNA-binding KH domain-containing protein PEPPER-like [Tanacetum cinerariifolium]
MMGHLRKFLVDRSVLPLFEKTNVAAVAAAPQEQQVEASWADKPMMRIAGSQLGLGGADYTLPMRRETLFLDREPPQRESLLTYQGLSLYGHDPALSTVLPTTRSARIARTGGLTQQVYTRLKEHKHGHSFGPEVITSAEFHPTHCHTLTYSSFIVISYVNAAIDNTAIGFKRRSYCCQVYIFAVKEVSAAKYIYVNAAIDTTAIGFKRRTTSVLHERTIHIEIDILFVRDIVTSG